MGTPIAPNRGHPNGVDANGKVGLRRKLRRDQVANFFANPPECLVGLEACGTSAYASARGKIPARSPVALAVQHDLVGTMRDSVEGGCAQQLVVEGVVPLREVQIAGDDRWPPLVAIRNDVVEVLVLTGAHWLEAEVVYDE